MQTRLVVAIFSPMVILYISSQFFFSFMVGLGFGSLVWFLGLGFLADGFSGLSCWGSLVNHIRINLGI